MLKSMMTSSGLPAADVGNTVPTYESIQRQLDELKLKAMKVDGELKTEDDQGVLLDSGSTHVLRPARDDRES